ncbi:MAG: phospho-N-acetylmuramoyl-pentapeptide-transferase [Thermoleophilia bacterium]|nr:phospho-N-acetylmuramoyl-pentapeptide-transferase [Thermoleophilia bacterium]
MTRMLLAGVVASLLVVLLGPFFIRWATRREFGQEVREDGPRSHTVTKQGTPTMGGLLILFGVTAAFLPYWLIGRTHTDFGLVVYATMMMCAAIGFWDDAMKVVNKRSLGINGKTKMLILALITVFLGWSSHSLLHISTVIEIPFTTSQVDLGWGYYLLLFFVLAGTSNTVNLADGLDGLAATTVVISLFAFTGIAFVLWDRQLGTVPPLSIGGPGALDIAIFCSALGGSLVGFLWWNAYPARVFMGDTGSLALGGALAAIAVVLKVELLLVVIGGIFVVEGLSVMLQTTVFKLSRRLTGTPRRLFLMAPIHHHFELKNWSETQVMTRFAIVASLFSATGFTIWFRTH